MPIDAFLSTPEKKYAARMVCIPWRGSTSMEYFDFAVFLAGPSMVWRLPSLFHTPSTMAALGSSPEMSVPSTSSSSSKFSDVDFPELLSSAKSLRMLSMSLSMQTRRVLGWAGGSAGEKEDSSASASFFSI